MLTFIFSEQTQASGLLHLQTSVLK